MPDLTTEYATACQTNREWQGTITGSTGTEYTVRWERDYSPRRTCDYHYTCSCPGFTNRGSCKHVRELEAQDIHDRDSRTRCGWDDRWDADGANDDGSCPCCGGPTFTYAYGA